MKYVKTYILNVKESRRLLRYKMHEARGEKRKAKIENMAKDMIKMIGLELEEVKIDYTGLMPGAFENYRYHGELFSTSRFRIAYDVIR